MQSLPSNVSPLTLPKSNDLLHLSYKPVFAEHPNLVFILMEKFPNLRTLNTQKVDEAIRSAAQYVNAYASPVLSPLIYVLEEMEHRARKDNFRLLVRRELALFHANTDETESNQ